MAYTVSFGSGGKNNNGQSYTGAVSVYVPVSGQSGNLNLDGTRVTTYNSISIDGPYSNCYPSYDGSNAYLNRSGSGFMYFSRYNGDGASVYETGGTPWTNGGLHGSYTWSTVPPAPASITFSSFTQSTLTLTHSFANSANDGGQTIESYSSQYRNTAAGIGITNIVRSASSAIITTASAHGYAVNGIIQVYGLTNSGTGVNQYDAEINGQWIIAAVTSNTITFSTVSRTVASHTPVTGSAPLVGLYGGWTGAKTVTSPFSFAGLTPARYYQMRVYSKNANGFSQASAATPYFVLPDPPTWVTKTTFLIGKKNIAYSDTVSVTGYTLDSPGFTVSSGSLPPGLSITKTQIDSDNATFTISGTPTQVGVYNFQITATNVGGSTASPTYTITIGSASDFWDVSPGKKTIADVVSTNPVVCNVSRNTFAYSTSNAPGIVATGDYLYASTAASYDITVNNVVPTLGSNGYEISPGLSLYVKNATATGVPGTTGTVNIARVYGTPLKSGTFNFVIRASFTGGTATADVPITINVRPTGKRYTSNTAKTQITTWKRYDATKGWVDVVIAKRYDPTNPNAVNGWIDLTNPS
jgi:hypothetical protein